MLHDPPGDMLLGPREVADWLDVDEGWVARAIEEEGLPAFGFESSGQPVVLVDDVRAWLRRPDPHADET